MGDILKHEVDGLKPSQNERFSETGNKKLRTKQANVKHEDRQQQLKKRYGQPVQRRNPKPPTRAKKGLLNKLPSVFHGSQKSAKLNETQIAHLSLETSKLQ